MILTITYTGENAMDLGYLLYKNPARPQSIKLSMGEAHVFYPEISDERTTVALVLDLDPLVLSKGKPGTGEAGLFDYVNDRPYVSSSFMSNALVKAFGTAMTGRCDSKPELVKSELDLEVKLYMLPVKGEKTLLDEFFEPLGYEVFYEVFPVDEKFASWGESPYVNLTLKGKKRLADMLNQLYVLIPTFDLEKHYYIGESEIDNIIRHGEGWLATHPAKEKIIRRCFRKARSYGDEVLRRLDSEENASAIVYHVSGNDESLSNTAREGENQAPLDKIRLETVKNEIIKSGAKSLIDIGCGEGKLLALLLDEMQVSKLAGADVSVGELKKAEKRIEKKALSERQRERVSLFQGSLMYKDNRFLGYDAVSVVEVLEHIDPEKLPVFENVLFKETAAKTIIVTTPNKAYNDNYGLVSTELRHTDHRFEWDTYEFEKWCANICDAYSYRASITGIGGKAGEKEYPTQMAVFTKDESKESVNIRGEA